MDDFVSRTDLVPPSRVKALSRRSDGRGLVQLASHLAALGLTGWLVWRAAGTWWLAPAMVLYGVVLAFLFTMHHECIHRTAFRTRWINDALSAVAGFLVFYPPLFFRHFHFTHHRFTQDPERDPEILAPAPRTRGEYLAWVSGLPYWRRRVGTSLRHALTGQVTQPYLPRRDHAAIVREARIVWTGYALIAALAIGFGSWAPVLYWLGPLALGQPFLRMYLLAEHTGTAFTSDALENARTTRSNPLVRWLAWNMPYHVEHHLYPGVPFHRLPALHEAVRPHLRVIAPGYAAVNAMLWQTMGR